MNQEVGSGSKGKARKADAVLRKRTGKSQKAEEPTADAGQTTSDEKAPRRPVNDPLRFALVCVKSLSNMAPPSSFHPVHAGFPPPRWFGVLVPPPLRAAQTSFKSGKQRGRLTFS